VPPITPRKPEQPVLWIIAGPNGSGKSSFYGRTDIEGWGGSVWIINPDLLTTSLAESEGLSQTEANKLALDRIWDWLHASIGVRQTIGVETVLSTGKYRRFVRLARERGFEVRLVYFVLRSAELQLQRIAQRVADGGHNVPRSKVTARRKRSFRQLLWFARNADRLYLYDNSTSEPELIASFEMDSVQVRPQRVPNDLRMMLARWRLTPEAALFACQSRRTR
jgi:predicted ABC-type ATPase